ncbi:hypothetical protein [Tropicibacter sp. S64]|uniref:hypothetical protein n=1 Tax=Tropicibacter sp. S64 TaxID=3415122 RepID=UPI003C7CAC4A
MAIDCPSRVDCVDLHERAGKMVAAQILHTLIAAMPCTIHAMLTDSAIQFSNRKRHRTAFEHIFGRVCRETEGNREAGQCVPARP